MVDSNFYKEELLKMRENYKSNPLKDINLSRPIWLDEQDPMFEIYLKKSMLLQKGQIVYATIVQANSILYKSFPPMNAPAHIVYSTEPYFMENATSLYDIACGIYEYKDREIDMVPEEWQEVARVIKDEYDRSHFTFSLNINEQPIECCMIPTMIYRKLLPKRKLCGQLFPVLAVPECKQVLILPKKYWTKEFKKAWTAGVI
jgi:hypothetical protein